MACYVVKTIDFLPVKIVVLVLFLTNFQLRRSCIGYKTHPHVVPVKVGVQVVGVDVERHQALKDGGKTISMLLVVLRLMVATLVPALEPM